MTSSTAQNQYTYSAEQIDALARAACETVVAEPGKVCSYDVEAFRRVDRCPMPTGEYPLYNPPVPECPPQKDPLPSESIGTEAYHLRIGGFRREDIFGPDESAQILSSAGITFADSLGQGLFEHLVLCRKYGVTPVFEAPAAGFPLPFLECELPTFERLYRREVQEFVGWVRSAEAVYGGPILQRSRQPWVLWGLLSPLALFMLSAARKPVETAEQLRQHSGVPRLVADPSTPIERASQLRAWAFVRRRHMEVRATMARALREVIAPGAILVDNTHALPIVDYQLAGEIYDHPGVAVRSGYLEEEHLREANVAFAVRLYRDLTGKTPIVSVRINTTAAGTRFIPGPGAIGNWCNAALRHGVAGFYFWPVDYPSQEGQYFGAMPGNDDPSARGRERWEEMLNVFREIAGTRCFLPPLAKIGILVPTDCLELAGWRRVFDTFVELENARLFAQLIPGRAVAGRDDALDPIDVVVAPACPFLSESITDRLEQYVKHGGTLLISCPEALQYDEHGHTRSAFAGLPIPLDNHRPKSCHNFGKGNIYLTQDVVQAVRDLGFGQESWIYQVRARSLRNLTGRAETEPLAFPEPDVKPKHYMYEHSSKTFMPYMENVTEFPSEDLDHDSV